MAVTFTATTMIAGVIPWYFMSSLRFSAEMALLLAISAGDTLAVGADHDPGHDCDCEAEVCGWAACAG